MKSTTLKVNSNTSLRSNSKSVTKNDKSVSTKASVSNEKKSAKIKKSSKKPKILKTTSIEDQPILPNLDDPSSYNNMMDLLLALKHEMTIKINEASTMIIQMGESYSFFFKPSEENLIIFRGLTAMISKNIYTEDTLEDLPWTEYQLTFDDPKPSVANYLSAPSKITENLLKIVENPQKVLKLSTFEKINKHYKKHKELYENFLNLEKKDGKYSSVVNIWIYVFVKIMNAQAHIDSQGMYDVSYLQHYNKKDLYFAIQKREDKKEEIMSYMKNITPILTVNGKSASNSNLLNITADHIKDNQKRRKSFSGLPLPSTYDEINEKIEGKKSKHVNAIAFNELLNKNYEKVIKGFVDEKQLDECTSEKVTNTEYTRKSLLRQDLCNEK